MARKLKALLLAAGLGTRLLPLTRTTPKCLVDIHGTLLIDIWISRLFDIGCTDILINTHHLPDAVSSHINDAYGSSSAITLIHEDTLLGTAGTLLEHNSWLRDSTCIVAHADNLLFEGLHSLLDSFYSRPNESILTLYAFTTPTPTSCGIITLNDRSLITTYTEKPKKPDGNLANGAIYVFDEYFLDLLQQMNPKPYDIGSEVLPLLVGRMSAFCASVPYFDIGTPVSLALGRQAWYDFFIKRPDS